MILIPYLSSKLNNYNNLNTSNLPAGRNLINISIYSKSADTEEGLQCRKNQARMIKAGAEIYQESYGHVTLLTTAHPCMQRTISLIRIHSLSLSLWQLSL